MRVISLNTVNNRKISFKMKESDPKKQSAINKQSGINAQRHDSETTQTDYSLALLREKEYEKLEENLINLNDKENAPFLLLYQINTNPAIIQISKEYGGMDITLISNPKKMTAELEFKFADKELKLVFSDYSASKAKTSAAIYLNRYVNPKKGKALFLKDVEDYTKKHRPFWKKLFNR